MQRKRVRIAARAALLALGIGLPSGLWPTSAFAVPRPAQVKPAPARPPVPLLAPEEIAEIRRKVLANGTQALEFKSALDDMRLAGPAAAPAVPIIVEALERGLSLPLTVAAIETLADVESPEATAVVATYAAHRLATVRRVAVNALRRTGGPLAVKIMQDALNDPDAIVRSSAALGLGSLRAPEAVTDLLRALDRGVTDAAIAVGQLCAPEQCRQFVAKLGALPVDAMMSGFEPLLVRPASAVGDDVKIHAIEKIRDQGTLRANQWLSKMRSRAQDAAMSPQVIRALDQAKVATSRGVQ